MKKLFKEEKNKLPLTFKFIEKLGTKSLMIKTVLTYTM
jgi:hypothetical protein